MLTSQHCQLFQRPFFQFAQLKKYAPETIPQLKADYQAAWRVWRSVIEQVSTDLSRDNPQFAPPHIERWCNGWQVRAHFFAFFKYAAHENDAVILSVLLNRRRLSVALDWHCYKADRSQITLPQYNQWLNNLNIQQFSDFDVWHGDESEYADYTPLFRLPENALTLRDKNDFFCIGKHLDSNVLSDVDSVAWITEQIRALVPLYEQCFA